MSKPVENMVDKPISIPYLIPSKTFSHIHWSDIIDSILSSAHSENKVADEDTTAPTKPTLEAEAIIVFVHDDLS